ncbi:hypothetical protein PoB_004643500 [Plakobranchus ocellatus]|uniref:Uncharacterized protein n=1 Tax=Plakobranchus ocellatus TaxID=259542 RepID=A0AAV4BHB1_9GAST|nr:hypothetical protein PoB_004643500 [Plakobranchus ocellatus]
MSIYIYLHKAFIVKRSVAGCVVSQALAPLLSFVFTTTGAKTAQGELDKNDEEEEEEEQEEDKEEKDEREDGRKRIRGEGKEEGLRGGGRGGGER